MLDISTAAVKSALQRARARLDEVAPSPDDVVEPADPRARELLRQYIAAFENADPAALEKGAAHRRRDRDAGHAHLVLRQVTLPALPGARARLARRLADDPDPRQRPARRGRLPPQRRRNLPGPRGRRARATPAGIARITVFPGGPGLVASFGLPATRTPCRPTRSSGRTTKASSASPRQPRHGRPARVSDPAADDDRGAHRTADDGAARLRGRRLAPGLRRRGRRRASGTGLVPQPRTNPAATVELGDGTYQARAVVTTGEERDRLYRAVSDGASPTSRTPTGCSR